MVVAVGFRVRETRALSAAATPDHGKQAHITAQKENLVLVARFKRGVLS